MFIFDKFPKMLMPTGETILPLCSKICNCIGIEFIYPKSLYPYNFEYGIFTLDPTPRCIGIPYPCNNMVCVPPPPR